MQIHDADALTHRRREMFQWQRSKKSGALVTRCKAHLREQPCRLVSRAPTPLGRSVPQELLEEFSAAFHRDQD